LGYKISPVRALDFGAVAFTETSDCCPVPHGVRIEFSKIDGRRQEAFEIFRKIIICMACEPTNARKSLAWL